MTIESYIDDLKGVHNNMEPSNVLDIIVKRFTDEMQGYKKMISQFFSRDVAERDIRKIYGMIENPNSVLFDREKTVKCVDLEKTFEIFNEYNEGMIQFVSDIIESKTTTSEEILSEFSDSLNKAKAKDKTFINTIFGGSYNPSKDCDINSALLNIEFMIKFRNVIDNMNTKFITLVDSVPNRKVDSLKYDAILLLKNSITFFTYRMIRECAENFYHINECINSTPEKAVEKFQLF
jgi:hypothetical protein